MNVDDNRKLDLALRELVATRQSAAHLEGRIYGGADYESLADDLTDLDGHVQGLLRAAGEAMKAEGFLESLSFGPRASEVKDSLRNLRVALGLRLDLDRAFKRFSLALAEVGWKLDLMDVARGLVAEPSKHPDPGAASDQQTTRQPVTAERPRRQGELAPSTPPKVFIVHGHDATAKLEVARTVEKLGLRAVILHEQANLSRAIIEKLEEQSDIAYAVVLLTPDDVGSTREDREALAPRARQNVILELGYFVARLGRNRVCTLYKEGVELPSDWNGVLFLPMDSAGGWRLLLAKEMRTAGLPIDLNRL